MAASKRRLELTVVAALARLASASCHANAHVDAMTATNAAIQW